MTTHTLNPTSLYDLSDGWICSAERLPKSDEIFWVWVTTNDKVDVMSRGLRQGPDVFWKPIATPSIPRRRTNEEIEQDAILEAWRGQSIDFCESLYCHIPSDFILAWKAGRDWARARESVK